MLPRRKTVLIVDDDEGTRETLTAILREDPAPLSKVTPPLPMSLERVVLHCLEKRPEDRYGSAEALADDLEHFLTGEPIRARPVGSGERLVKWARRQPVSP